jgi:hypothetical protein
VAVLTRQRALPVPARATLIAFVVFCVALAALVWVRAESAPNSRPSDSTAHAAVFTDPVAGQHLARLGFDDVRTTPLDDETVRVSFFNGRRIVLEAAVSAGGRVGNMIRYDENYVRTGSEIAQRTPVLVALLTLFLLATIRLPLRRIENLDVVALAAFVVPVVLMNARYLEWSVLSACAPLVYLAARCAVVALGPGRTAPATWVFDRVPRRIGRLAVAVAAGALVLLSIPGGLVGDVALASLSGATKMLDGTLPYGNLAGADVVHGDTYPLLAYLAYIPAAALSPVNDGFDNLDGALWISTGCALAAAGALGVAARRAGGAGVRTALAMLAFPPIVIAASSGSNDTVAAALVALALATASTAVLTAAGWVKLAPFALVPLWIAAARDRGRALVGALVVTAVLAAAVALLGGPAGFADMVQGVSFQAVRGSLVSPWALLDAGGAQVVFQAAVVAGIALACLGVGRDRTLACDARRMAALGAAVMLAVQLAANYWSYTYLAWVFPLIAVALLSGATPSRPRGPSA